MITTPSTFAHQAAPTDTDAAAAEVAAEVTAADQITEADLDVVERVVQAAQELWPVYAETHDISRPGSYSFTGLNDYGSATFTYHYHGGSDEQDMDLSYLLDKAALIAQARQARERREAALRARREAEAAAEQADRERQKAAQQAADLATWRRMQGRIERGEIDPNA